ncbi:OLC1v1021419C1 [Oldenlandia corymbosa var. corymbosa]|uniref:OLC1v1021419C1 n=1 Tax=Oldenlandia corymbosa var. corymbosa TaxID=529605 RepID=A0AAV1BWU1_OLDCO|nr:OLC1v1021419C1 [Oldenlandia corymbosa var. corymbosa]
MVLPLLKLGTLALKTISKPIATRLKVEAGRHPKFRNLIVRMAQSNHRITTQMQRRIYGHATDVEIRPLNEEKAVQAAADLLGEIFVFTVAGVAVIFEVQRSSRSEAKKEELRRQEMEVNIVFLRQQHPQPPSLSWISLVSVSRTCCGDLALFPQCLLYLACPTL